MATNKHAIIRYQTLDKCFRNPGRKYFVDDLLTACNDALFQYGGISEGIKRRQLFEDLIFMESEQGWNIPLNRISEGRKVYYRYADISYSINTQPLNVSEQSQLREALMTLSRFKGMPQFEWMDELTARLESELGLSQATSKIIEFEQNPFLRGLDHFTPVYNAILYQKAIQIDYKGFSQEKAQSLLFHPWFLKQYNSRWFVFGLSDELRVLKNLALDRIQVISDTSFPYQHNKAIDFQEYFDDIVGVTVMDGIPLEKVELRVENSLYRYIQTKPIHGSQREVSKNECNTTISLLVIPNYELESVILSHGDRIEVVKPEWLRERITSKIQGMNSRYEIRKGVE